LSRNDDVIVTWQRRTVKKSSQWFHHYNTVKGGVLRFGRGVSAAAAIKKTEERTNRHHARF
jgi:hypothetical protein